MPNNLNNLSIEEIQLLEKYILSKIEDKEVEGFFIALKEGRLKNKNVDIDALNFIYDGLSELVEKWMQENYKRVKIEERTQKEPKSIENNDNIKDLKRSANLKLKRKKSNFKFIDGDYIYLFHGDKAGQKEGFYSFDFKADGVNIEEYTQKTGITLESLVYQHGLRGKGRFISATTDLDIAEQFASQYEDGSIYLIKIRKEDAYHINSPIDDFVAALGSKSLKGEEEYLIPDCIYQEEVFEEFKCYEHRKIFSYLRHKIGLNILSQDIGLPEISERVEEMNRAANKLYWQLNGHIQDRDTNLKELAENPEEFEGILNMVKSHRESNDDGRQNTYISGKNYKKMYNIGEGKWEKFDVRPICKNRSINKKRRSRKTKQC